MISSLPQGMAETLGHREILLAYRANPEAQAIASTLMSEDGKETFRFVHLSLDSPAIALRALELHRGRTLPIYNELSRRPFDGADHTRTITDTDVLQIIHGPEQADNSRKFITWVSRSSVPPSEIF